MDVIGDPGSMRAEAAQLRIRSDALAGMGDRIRGQIESMAFAGPVADRFRASMVDRDLRIRRLAERLQVLATEVERSAAVVEESIAEQLRQAEQPS